MKRQHPHPADHLPVSMEISRQLKFASVATGFKKEDWEIAEMAIRAWMVHNSPNAIKHPFPFGYQWKDVFLPAGTLLRTVFDGKNHHCIVDNDELIYNGTPTTPNKFIAAVGGMRRSAWKSIWVLFPNEQVWSLAAQLRSPHRA